MSTFLLAALSLASSVMLDVPFVPQTDALCGGAAAAMVFRYWGDAHADVEQFAPLVDRHGRGIADDVLIDAVRRRGWQALRVDGSIEELRSRLRDRQPVIVLVADRRDTYHYLVVTGATADRIIVHDPSWGPSRAIPEREFVRVWKPTNFWSLVVQPTDAVSPTPATPRATLMRDREDACDALLERAIADVQVRGLSAADSLLTDLRARCPASAGPPRELAGVRFAQRRWSEAAAFAREALVLEAQDEYSWDVLGSSLFVQDDATGALRAWNRIGKPRIDAVRIDGIQRARYQAIADALAIRPNTVLTAETFERARRRIDDLPDRASARIAFRPQADGFATVDVVVSERSIRPRGPAEWATAAARAAIDREVMVAVPGGTGQGELWTASWRWWSERPRVAVGFATPRAGRLPGVWRVDASWEEQSYMFDAGSTGVRVLRESRVHGGLTVNDWMTGTIRYSVGAGVDTWNSDRKTAFAGASLERRSLGDRVSLAASATNWMLLKGLTSDRGFASVEAHAQFRSSSRLDGWVYRGALVGERVSDAGPLALWPGAGDGHARAPLLRAHPLLEGGTIDATRSSAFGRTLTYANVEVQRWFARPLVPRLGLAAFADAARASRGAAASSVPHLDLGGGLRIRIPGAEGVLRIDAAHGIRDGANALTFGWQF